MPGGPASYNKQCQNQSTLSAILHLTMVFLFSACVANNVLLYAALRQNWYNECSKHMHI